MVQPTIPTSMNERKYFHYIIENILENKLRIIGFSMLELGNPKLGIGEN